MKWPESIIINGQSYHKGDEASIRKMLLMSDNLLLKQTGLFLMDWFDPSPWLVLKTSGSTGEPKSLQIPKNRLLLSARMTLDFFGLYENKRFLLCLSPEFIAGKMMIVRAMLSGAELITAHVEANPLKNLEQPIDFTAMVPLQLSVLLKENPEKLELIKTIIIGGSALPSQLENELQQISSNCWHTYGMTETLSHIALRPVNGRQAEKWFSPLEGVLVALNQQQCLKITAPALLEQPIDTHDLAEINAEGKFKILGRVDEVIVSAGHKIHPTWLEEKIGIHIHGPFAITSMADQIAGEKVVLALAEDLTVPQLYKLWEALEACLMPAEMPRYITSLPEWPVLKSGKTDRRKLKLSIQQQINQPS